MRGIFISHSTKNRKLVEHVVELLQLGMGMEKCKIFCTSLEGMLPTGKDFVDIIKEEVKNRGMVLAIITPEYLKSRFCIMELGAAWVEAEYLCLILACGADEKDLEDSPLAKVQMRRADRESDWCVIYDELVRQQIISTNTTQFNKKLQEFIKYIESCTEEGDRLYAPDSEGKYCVSIEKERVVPKPYKCYKIKGKLEIEGLEKWLESESHWIFYEEGVFDDLKAGDHVQLEIEKTERRYFYDIGTVRNIYPSKIIIEKSSGQG